MIRVIAPSRDGSLILTLADDGYVIAWDTSTTKARWAQTCAGRRFDRHGFDTCAVLDDDHAILANGQVLRFVRMRDGHVVKEISEPGYSLIDVQADGTLLVSLATKDQQPFAILKAWTMVVRKRFGSKTSQRSVVKGPGTLLLLVAHAYFPKRIEAWHTMGTHAGSLAWTSAADRLFGACVLPDRRIAALSETGVTFIDALTGATSQHEKVPVESGVTELRWVEGQLMRCEFSNFVPYNAEDSGVPRGDLLRAAHVPFDVWHRDHADVVPADPSPQWFSGESWMRPGVRTEPLSICADNDGHVAVATSDGTVVRWDLTSRCLVARERIVFELPSDHAWQARMHADRDQAGRRLVCGDQAGNLQLLDAVTGHVVMRIATGVQNLGLIALCPTSDACVVVSGSTYERNRMLVAYDLSTGSCRWQRTIERMGSCCFSGSQAQLFLACGDHVRTLSTSDGSEVGTCVQPAWSDRQDGHQAFADDLYDPIAVSSDGRHLAAGGMGSPLTWAVAQPDSAKHVRIANDGVSALAWSPNGFLLAAGEAYCPWITVRDVRDGTQFRLSGHVDRVCALAFTPDGRHLIGAGADGFVTVWSTTNWTRLFQLTLLPTAKAESQQWCIIAADGSMTGSPGFDAYLNSQR